MNSEINKVIKSIIPKAGIIKSLKANDLNEAIDFMYEIADHDSLFKFYIEMDLPQMLFIICEESITALLETEEKESVIRFFKNVVPQIAYIEDKPVPDKFFEQFNK